MEPPSFPASSPHVVRAAPGSDASVLIPLPSGSPPFHYEWSRAGAKLDDRFKPSVDAGGVRLTISASRTGDSGVYTLQASNAAGKDTTRVRLEVSPDEKPTGDDPPTFLRRLQDLTVKVGTRTRFLVEIVSSTECRVTWYRNERRLLEAERIALVRDGNFWCADISAVSVDDAGRWTCTAENVGGRASCSAHLNVLVPKAYKRPEFVEELRALLTEQGTVSLECKVVGVPTPVLRWFKDSREIKAGDVFALTANAEDPTSLGTYTCEAVNCMGRAYSSSKVHVIGRASRETSARPTTGGVALEPPPIFTKELEDQFVRICEALTLSCHIVVPPWPRSVVWYNKEGKIEPNDKYRVQEDGVGGYLLEIPSVEWQDEGEWKCVATSSGGRIGITTCYVSMDVPKNYRKPRFMENLQAVLTEEGLVSFECKVVGFPTPVLSWFKDGQELKPGDVYQLTGTNSLGSYCCIAKNCMGQASSSAELTVEDIQNQLNEEEKLQLFSKNQAPKFLQGLKSVEAKIDEPFRFTIKVTIPPEPTVLWYRDDQPVDESSRCHHGKEERGVFFLDIQSLEFMDQAEWKCVAMNDFGHSVTSCFLKLIIPRHYKKPRFLENLQAILSDEGAVNLECKVIGVPQPVLKWYKDGEELKPGDIHRIISGQDGTCCLGTYTCEAQNCMGIAASSASLLGFEDSIKSKSKKNLEEQTLQRNLSLSTIHEERTSQMYDTPVGDITLDDKGEISFSFDGKEVSVSLYETPDLTEEEALQIVEMYADQLSENVTEHNVVELPPLRFVKETSTSGNLLMEAIIIDVSPEYFTSPEEDLRTEADVEDISIADENGPPQLSLDQEMDAEDYLEKTIALLSDEKVSFPKKIDRKKSDSQKSADDYYSLSRDQSLSEEKKDDDTQVLSESDLQSFASARSSGKPKSKSSKPSFEDGQESSEVTKTVILNEDLQIYHKQNELDSVIKNKRERRSRSSRRSSSGSEKSINKMKEDNVETSLVNISVQPFDRENIKNDINNISLSLAKVLNEIQMIERDIILKSELMSTTATASRSLEIISSLITPLSEMHSITEAIKETTSESPEAITSLFERLPQFLSVLYNNLTIIEKCIDVEIENKTLVKKTSKNIIGQCGEQLCNLVREINLTVERGRPFVTEVCASAIHTSTNELLNTLKSSISAIKELKTTSNATDSNADIVTPDLKHLEKTQKAIYELRNPLKSLLYIAEEVDIYSLVTVENVTNNQIILNDMSTPIQDLQNALEQIELLSVTENQLNLQKYNTEIIETVMESVIKLRTSFEQLSVEVGTIDNVDILNEILVSIKQNINEISAHLDIFEAKIGPFNILQSENKLEALQKMAQILINLENNLIILDIMPSLKMNMTDFHKNLTKVLEHVIESNDAKKYLTFLEICDAVNRLNNLIKNMDFKDVLSLAAISNNLKIIQTNIQKNEFTPELNFLIMSNTNDLLANIHENISHADTSSYSMISENAEDLSIRYFEEEKLNIVLQQIEKAIITVSNVISLETTTDLEINQALNKIIPSLGEIKCCVASLNVNVIDQVDNVSDLSNSTFTQAVANPLCDLNHGISVLNQIICEKAADLSEKEDIRLELRTPLVELRHALEILQQDVVSQIGENVNNPIIRSTIANAVQSVQNCIVVIQEQDLVENIDELSTLEDISAIKTSAEVLPNDYFITPIIEEIKTEICSETVQSALVTTLQCLNDEILKLKRSEILETLNVTSEYGELTNIKSFVANLDNLNSAIETILHPSVCEESQEVSGFVHFAQSLNMIQPLEELCQNLLVTEFNNMPVENTTQMEQIKSWSESVLNFKNCLRDSLDRIHLAIETADVTLEISTEIGSLQKHCEEFKKWLNTNDALMESSALLILKESVNTLYNTINCPREIDMPQIKLSLEQLHQNIITAQDDILGFALGNSIELEQEIRILKSIDDFDKSVSSLVNLQFLDIAQDSNCDDYVTSQVNNKVKLNQVKNTAEIISNYAQNSSQDINFLPIKDLVELFNNEIILLSSLLQQRHTPKRIIKMIQIYYGLCKNLRQLQLHKLNSDTLEDFDKCIVSSEECLKNIQPLLLEILENQSHHIFDIPISNINNVEILLNELLGANEIENENLLDIMKLFINTIKSIKPWLGSVQVDLIRELKSCDINLSTEEDVDKHFNLLHSFLSEKTDSKCDTFEQDFKNIFSVVEHHSDCKRVRGTVKKAIFIKCLSDCLDVLKQTLVSLPSDKDQKLALSDNNLIKILMEMDEIVEGVHGRSLIFSSQSLHDLDKKEILKELNVIDSNLETINNIKTTIENYLESKSLSLKNNYAITLTNELLSKIHTIQKNLVNLECIYKSMDMKINIHPINDIERILSAMLPTEVTKEESTQLKEKTESLLQHMEHYIEVIEIVEEVSAVIKLDDFKKSVDIVRELRDTITSQSSPDVIVSGPEVNIKEEHIQLVQNLQNALETLQIETFDSEQELETAISDNIRQQIIGVVSDLRNDLVALSSTYAVIENTEPLDSIELKDENDLISIQDETDIVKSGYTVNNKECASIDLEENQEELSSVISPDKVTQSDIQVIIQPEESKYILEDQPVIKSHEVCDDNDQSESAYNIQEVKDTKADMEFSEPEILDESKIITLRSAKGTMDEKSNTMQELESLLQDVNENLSEECRPDNHSENLRDTLEEVQSIIMKLKSEFAGSTNDILNENIEDLECNVRSVQLQINENSPPALLKEACANLQSLATCMNKICNTQDNLTEPTLNNHLSDCTNNVEQTIDLLDLMPCYDSDSKQDTIILNLNVIKDAMKSLKSCFSEDAATVIVNGIEILQNIDVVEDKVFALEKELEAKLTIDITFRDNLITAIHSIYGSISNMRGTICSIQKKYMYDNYGQPSDNFLKAIKNIKHILGFDENRDWAKFAKSLRKVLNHFEDIKFYINLDKTARIPSDCAFTKIILGELSSVLSEVVLRNVNNEDNDLKDRVINAAKHINDILTKMENKTTLEVKEKIPIFKELSIKMIELTECIKIDLQRKTNISQQLLHQQGLSLEEDDGTKVNTSDVVDNDELLLSCKDISIIDDNKIEVIKTILEEKQETHSDTLMEDNQKEDESSELKKYIAIQEIDTSINEKTFIENGSKTVDQEIYIQETAKEEIEAQSATFEIENSKESIIHEEIASSSAKHIENANKVDAIDDDSLKSQPNMEESQDIEKSDQILIKHTEHKIEEISTLDLPQNIELKDIDIKATALQIENIKLETIQPKAEYDVDSMLELGTELENNNNMMKKLDETLPDDNLVHFENETFLDNTAALEAIELEEQQNELQVKETVKMHGDIIDLSSSHDEHEKSKDKQSFLEYGKMQNESTSEHFENKEEDYRSKICSENEQHGIDKAISVNDFENLDEKEETKVIYLSEQKIESDAAETTENEGKIKENLADQKLLKKEDKNITHTRDTEKEKEEEKVEIKEIKESDSYEKKQIEMETKATVKTADIEIKQELKQDGENIVCTQDEKTADKEIKQDLKRDDESIAYTHDDNKIEMKRTDINLISETLKKREYETTDEDNIADKQVEQYLNKEDESIKHTEDEEKIETDETKYIPNDDKLQKTEKKGKTEENVAEVKEEQYLTKQKESIMPSQDANKIETQIIDTSISIDEELTKKAKDSKDEETNVDQEVKQNSKQADESIVCIQDDNKIEIKRTDSNLTDETLKKTEYETKDEDNIADKEVEQYLNKEDESITRTEGIEKIEIDETKCIPNDEKLQKTEKKGKTEEKLVDEKEDQHFTKQKESIMPTQNANKIETQIIDISTSIDEVLTKKEWEKETNADEKTADKKIKQEDENIVCTQDEKTADKEIKQDLKQEDESVVCTHDDNKTEIKKIDSDRAGEKIKKREYKAQDEDNIADKQVEQYLNKEDDSITRTEDEGKIGIDETTSILCDEKSQKTEKKGEAEGKVADETEEQNVTKQRESIMPTQDANKIESQTISSSICTDEKLTKKAKDSKAEEINVDKEVNLHLKQEDESSLCTQDDKTIKTGETLKNRESEVKDEENYANKQEEQYLKKEDESVTSKRDDENMKTNETDRNLTDEKLQEAEEKDHIREKYKKSDQYPKKLDESITLTLGDNEIESQKAVSTFANEELTKKANDTNAEEINADKEAKLHVKQEDVSSLPTQDDKKIKTGETLKKKVSETKDGDITDKQEKQYPKKEGEIVTRIQDDANIEMKVTDRNLTDEKLKRTDDKDHIKETIPDKKGNQCPKTQDENIALTLDANQIESQKAVSTFANEELMKKAKETKAEEINADKEVKQHLKQENESKLGTQDDNEIKTGETFKKKENEITLDIHKDEEKIADKQAEQYLKKEKEPVTFKQDDGNIETKKTDSNLTDEKSKKKEEKDTIDKKVTDNSDLFIKAQDETDTNFTNEKLKEKERETNDEENTVDKQVEQYHNKKVESIAHIQDNENNEKKETDSNLTHEKLQKTEKKDKVEEKVQDNKDKQCLKTQDNSIIYKLDENQIETEESRSNYTDNELSNKEKKSNAEEKSAYKEVEHYLKHDNENIVNTQVDNKIEINKIDNNLAGEKLKPKENEDKDQQNIADNQVDKYLKKEEGSFIRTRDDKTVETKKMDSDFSDEKLKTTDIEGKATENIANKKIRQHLKQEDEYIAHTLHDKEIETSRTDGNLTNEKFKKKETKHKAEENTEDDENEGEIIKSVQDNNKIESKESDSNLTDEKSKIKDDVVKVEDNVTDKQIEQYLKVDDESVTRAQDEVKTETQKSDSIVNDKKTKKKKKENKVTEKEKIADKEKQQYLKQEDGSDAREKAEAKEPDSNLISENLRVIENEGKVNEKNVDKDQYLEKANESVTHTRDDETKKTESNIIDKKIKAEEEIVGMKDEHLLESEAIVFAQDNDNDKPKETETVSNLTNEIFKNTDIAVKKIEQCLKTEDKSAAQRPDDHKFEIKDSCSDFTDENLKKENKEKAEERIADKKIKQDENISCAQDINKIEIQETDGEVIDKMPCEKEIEDNIKKTIIKKKGDESETCLRNGERNEKLEMENSLAYDKLNKTENETKIAEKEEDHYLKDESKSVTFTGDEGKAEEALEKRVKDSKNEDETNMFAQDDKVENKATDKTETIKRIKKKEKKGKTKKADELKITDPDIINDQSRIIGKKQEDELNAGLTNITADITQENQMLQNVSGLEKTDYTLVTELTGTEIRQNKTQENDLLKLDETGSVIEVSSVNSLEDSYDKHGKNNLRNTEVRELQSESKKSCITEVKPRPSFIDRSAPDYELEFMRPSAYTSKPYDIDISQVECKASNKTPPMYKAQSIVHEAQLKSSVPSYLDQQSAPSEGYGDVKHRSKAMSESRSIKSEKRSTYPRDSKRKPVFSTHLTDRTAVESSRVKLTCSILSPTDPVIYWYKNGKLLDNKQKCRTKYVDGLITLEILNAVPGDSGEYSCTVENENGSITSSANLKVYPGFETSPIPPTFTRSIRDIYHLYENELVLECRIRGQPLPKITWLKDNRPIVLNERYQAHYLADGVCRLTIMSPNEDDSGKYTCKAENSMWSDQISHDVHFTSKERCHIRNISRLDNIITNRSATESRRPHFINVLSDHKVVSGGTLGLQVEISGSPTRVEWLREGRSITDTYTNAQTYIDHGLYTLALPNVTEKESGLYTCRAWGTHENVDMNASVIVVQPNELEGKPAIIISRPAKDLLISVGEDLNISFRVQGEPKPKVFFMKGIRDITNSQRVCKMTSDDYVKFTLKRSVVSDAGTYCVFARNAYGCDRAFVTVVIRQRASSESLISDWTYPMDDLAVSVVDRNYKSVPDRIPSEPNTVDGGSNWISLAWLKPESHGKAPILAYKVESWLLGKEGGARWIELGITPRNTFDAFNLKQGEEYHFRVTPRNRYGWGESVQTTTPIGIGLAGDRPEFIELLPGQLKVLVGEAANLSCSFKGNPMPGIIWMKNGHEVEEETERVVIELSGNNTSLRINDINIGDEGRYSCEATNIHGRSSTYSRMAVITDKTIWAADVKLKRERSAGANGEYPPQFTMRLRDRRVQATYPVRLTCQVIGNPSPIVTWFKNGEQVTEDSRHSTSQDEYFHTLEIAPTTLDDGGVYEAMARNGSGAISCRCNLVVDKGIRAYIAPEFCCGFEPLYSVCEGDELRILAVVEAYPSVGVTWYRDGVRLRPSRRAVMTLDRDGQIELALASVATRDAGVYTCTASNEVGRASTSGKVEVVKAEHTSETPKVPPIVVTADLPYSKEPMFIRKPRSSEAREGDTVLLECEVIGDPKPEVYWLRDFLKPDYYRDASHFKRVGAGPGYRFEIPHAKLDYTGAYSIVAKNIHGEAKAIISLQILAKDPSCSDDTHNIRYGRVDVIPRFEKELTDLLCYDGDAIEFECRISGNPEPDIRWFHYTEVVPECSDFETSFEHGTARLKIKQVTAEDEGTYICEASNNMGKATSSACLVIYPPGEPNTLSQTLRRPPALLSAASTPRSTPRTTPARSLSRTPGPDLRRLGSPSREIAPKFYTYPYNKVVEEGDTVVFQCAVRGLPPPWATWDKDGIIITPTARISIREKDDMFRILEIEEVTIEDVGLYRVTLENDYGRAEASARLEVISQSGKFHGSRSYSVSPRRCQSYRRRTPSLTRHD